LLKNENWIIGSDFCRILSPLVITLAQDKDLSNLD